MRFLPKKLRRFIQARDRDIVLYAIAFMAAVHIFNSQGLFADGSYYLLRILSYGSCVFSDESRRFVVAVFQVPVVLGIVLGIKNIDWLIWLHSFGLFAFPVAFWLTALGRLRKEPYFWPFVAIFAVVYLNTGYCGVGEYNPAYAVAACSMAILLARKRIARVDGLLFATTGFILLGAYEALVFLGPMLFTAAMLRLAQNETRDRAEFFWVSIASFFFAAATAIAAWSILYPRDPRNLANAGSLSVLFRDRQILISMGVGGLYFAFWGLRAYAIEARKLGVAALVFTLLLIIPLAWAAPIHHYLARSIAGAVMFGLFGVLVLVRFGGRDATLREREERTDRTSVLVRRVPVLLLMILLVPDLCLSFGFRDYVQRFRKEVNATTGFVSLEDTHLTEQDKALFGWTWTYPSMSQLLRQDEQKAIILNPVPKAPGKAWEPFDPRKGVFDITRYYHRP